MSKIKNYELLQKTLKFFRKLSKASVYTPIIVEGKHDKSSLEFFGVSNIHTLVGLSLNEVPKQLSSKRVIILTDYDKEGKKLTAKLSYFLEREGITPILRFKAALGKLLKITEIESIPKFIENFTGGYFNGKDKSYFREIYNPWSCRSGRSCGRT